MCWQGCESAKSLQRFYMVEVTRPTNGFGLSAISLHESHACSHQFSAKAEKDKTVPVWLAHAHVKPKLKRAYPRQEFARHLEAV